MCNIKNASMYRVASHLYKHLSVFIEFPHSLISQIIKAKTARNSNLLLLYLLIYCIYSKNSLYSKKPFKSIGEQIGTEK